MNRLLEFFQNYFKTMIGVLTSVIFATVSAFFLSSRQGIQNQSFLNWLLIIFGTLALLVIALLMLLLFLKQKKALGNNESRSIQYDLKTIFKKIKRKNFKDIPLILFTGGGDSSADELFSRANFNLFQLNKKEDNGFAVWYSPSFILLDVSSELFDITSVASPLVNRNFKILLKFLRKKRKFAPINSYVISLPFNYFSQVAISDLKDNAKNLAKVLENIQQILKIRFPVYLLMDRVDLVYGFYDYATTLGDDGLKQMLGWSSDLKINEVLDEKSINNYFEELSNNIYKPLYKEQTKLALKAGKSEIPLFCFCKTIKNIMPSLQCFIENVFSSMTWHFNPLQLRGVFLTAIKGSSKYCYMSYSDINLQLRYCRLPLDMQAQQVTGLKDNSVFFLEDLFQNKILKERNLISYTDSFLLFIRTLKVLLLIVTGTAIFIFIYYSILNIDVFNKNIMTVKSYSWGICSNTNNWENGRFSPLLVVSGDGKYALKNSIINEKDNLAFVLDFYKQNDIQINIPPIYSLSEWIVGINREKNRARNTVLYTSILNPLLEVLLQLYAVKINKFDDLTAEMFANVFEYAKVLSDYGARKESFFPFYLGVKQVSGLYLYLEDTYRYLLKNCDKNTDNKLKMLSDMKIDLQQLFSSDSSPYGIGNSFAKLKNSNFMKNGDAYQSNMSQFIDFCIQDYMLGPKSVNPHHYQVNELLIKEFLADAENYKKNKDRFFQNLSVDEIVNKGKSLKKLVGTINNTFTDLSTDKKMVVMRYALVAREQDAVKNSRVLILDDTANKIKFDVNEDFRNTLFFELGLKKNLYRNWFINEILTKEQKYLFYPFYKMFNSKNNIFTKQYAKEFDTLKTNLLYGLALKNLINLLSEYNNTLKDNTINNIFTLLDNKEIEHNENIDFVIRYLVEFSVISKFLDILSTSSFPFTFKELQSDENLVRNVDKLNNALDGLLPLDITVKETQGKTDAQPVKFQKLVEAEQNLPPVIKQWISGAKKIISFIHANRDFVSKIYLLGQDYSKYFKQNSASDVWVAIEFEQENANYKSTPVLTRIKDNFLLDKIELTECKPLKIKFYRTLESLSNHQSNECLFVGTLPLMQFMIDNPNPVPMLDGKYFITWGAAKFDKDMNMWISKISFIYKNQKEFNMYVAFTMPEGAECLRGCLESDDEKLMLKRLMNDVDYKR